MDSICAKSRFAGILTAAVCFNIVLSLADGAALPEVKKDTVYIQVPAPAPSATGHARPAEDMGYLVERRDRFQRMQNNGFGLLMGGIGAGVGGVLLMVTGANQMDRNNRVDQYGNETRSGNGETALVIGYLAAVLVAPPLITTGIILNRVGNHKRERFQQDIDAGGRVDLGIGPNSVRLSYSF
ncbi:MAG: hypothetical protein JWO30_2709 [Fibrobacteres bacterium]|nr:hypothetical protein [Fibrobacterota bacterium]